MFERASTIIRDGSKLDFDYVPVNLIHRESQMASLETLFRPLAERGRPCTAFLTGSGYTIAEPLMRIAMDLGIHDTSHWATYIYPTTLTLQDPAAYSSAPSRRVPGIWWTFCILSTR